MCCSPPLSPPRMRNGETPWAFVEPRKGSALTEADLVGFCRQHLSGFKRPRRIVFGELPRPRPAKFRNSCCGKPPSGW
ncbi:AMP-binding enzyme [Sulfitobacter faviae]|uniref:AMP-binding enzyme n=1 Tax=Sulfitobacter faviae TaxID=1775881 RepID=UPI00398D1266